MDGPLRSIKKEKFFTAGYTRTSNIYLTLVSYAEQKMFVIGRVIVVFFLQHGLINCQSEGKKLIGDQSGFVSVAFRGIFSFKAYYRSKIRAIFIFPAFV